MTDNKFEGEEFGISPPRRKLIEDSIFASGKLDEKPESLLAIHNHSVDILEYHGIVSALADLSNWTKNESYKRDFDDMKEEVISQLHKILNSDVRQKVAEGKKEFRRYEIEAQRLELMRRQIQLEEIFEGFDIRKGLGIDTEEEVVS